ncbi:MULTISPECIES: urease subunit gamma [Streptomyces]|uniref:Urease subunit gamma n=1 Tax=Streptomyces thermoviolaceus subsp. thermoviolaceus TaxID=66860 RepID=A0ABX0YPQ5_STRTL|nr:MULTISPECIES: urease subunit gamma [Streptomyces]MCM3263291.1 urease subunit gamma [Streptomyces thermoviolaceus]NJP13156.1 urease subunit gamma [Streptomyces thermoviolaceus subsp. thermoviolaceus]RSS00671.1 urease subunit gamma [Streptomyces sp. WAC00469]WTD47010.1 urease subunit gamma [Streptomyces thermoviolaceus]GGV78787.1 urease subunit gamma [Streptomyces thermoviolaceus subsp. apingens]
MNLAPREIDKLLVYVVADLARRRRERGLKLNYSESVALITEAILEAARDGKTVAECMELGRTVLAEDDTMPGVREMLPLLQVEATFDDGTKLVSCHDPIGG